ncbi:hypothetical protein FGO68_gene12593 [Halteria grandinella]|uniref:Uncharacterized protein n=1 Tax=Halteria grandinella TaxID=5974 RepID=A0A8J8ND64_HALGN|nr:hypothetical protein FGO68_gene12593 [Halteria grandinella]
MYNSTQGGLQLPPPSGSGAGEKRYNSGAYNQGGGGNLYSPQNFGGVQNYHSHKTVNFVRNDFNSSTLSAAGTQAIVGSQFPQQKMVNGYQQQFMDNSNTQSLPQIGQNSSVAANTLTVNQINQSILNMIKQRNQQAQEQQLLMGSSPSNTGNSNASYYSKPFGNNSTNSSTTGASNNNNLYAQQQAGMQVPQKSVTQYFTKQLMGGGNVGFKPQNAILQQLQQLQQAQQQQQQEDELLMLLQQQQQQQQLQQQHTQKRFHNMTLAQKDKQPSMAMSSSHPLISNSLNNNSNTFDNQSVQNLTQSYDAASGQQLFLNQSNFNQQS